MNLNKKIRNQAFILSIVIILVFSFTPISTIFYKARNDINAEVNTIRTSSGNTWTVDDDGTADFNNIQAAVDAASITEIKGLNVGFLKFKCPYCGHQND